MAYFPEGSPQVSVRASHGRLPTVTADRARMMEHLGLHPATPVDGLMTIFRCAANTAALRPRKLEALLRSQRNDA